MRPHVTNGNGHSGLAPRLKAGGRGGAPTVIDRDRESSVTFQTSDGVEIRGTPVRLSRHAIVFEIYNLDAELRMSEALNGFKIVMGGRPVFLGRAIVSGLINAGTLVVCEAKLNEPESETAFFLPPPQLNLNPQQAYDQFFRQWQNGYRISPEFKVLVTDIQAFLTGVRHWLEGVDFSSRENAQSPESGSERALLESVAQRVIASFNVQHERFEELAYAIPEELRGAHEDFVRRHWHKLFLCTPFGHRTYHKPLGYAGDYEMMDMIHRNQPEGKSLYEKLIHLLLVSQWPAQSVRNRIAHLKENIIRETARAAHAGKRLRILNIGCGPARELQDFLKETTLSNEADFTLLDFNAETLNYASSRLLELKRRFARRSRIETLQISVHQLLRRAVKPEAASLGGNYDLIYCAGLFDYLSEETCRELVNLFYDNLSPGGLIVVANMDDAKPFRNFIEFVLDWQLIYRRSDGVRAFAPERAVETTMVVAEPASVNLFLHVRKPA